jgi:hypothetical protein
MIDNFETSAININRLFMTLLLIFYIKNNSTYTNSIDTINARKTIKINIQEQYNYIVYGKTENTIELDNTTFTFTSLDNLITK